MPYDGSGPTVAPDVRPPDDYILLDVNPDQFGAAIGRGLQQLGQGVEQAERFHGQLTADDATHAFQSQADKILNGDPFKQVQGPDGTMVPDSGFHGLKGEAAMRAWPEVRAQIDQLRQQGGAGAALLLSNPNVRPGDLVGDAAIRANGGDPNAPAIPFTTRWRDKFNGIRTTALPSPRARCRPPRTRRSRWPYRGGKVTRLPTARRA